MRFAATLLLALAISTGMANAGAAETGTYPRLFFRYAEPFDLSCRTDAREPITQEMQNELQRRMPELLALWNGKGVRLLRATLALLGKGFGRREETVALSLCPWFPPMSAPLMIRMRSYLVSASSPGAADFYKRRDPGFYFVSQLYHELLHTYLDRNFPQIDDPARSALIAKYRGESPGVRIHLHLLALQKAVYLKLGLDGEIHRIIELDSEIPGARYKRAWEIVNTEGYGKFLDELRRYR